ncbi:MAG: hypothetical protein ACD_56C00113G0001 [uncultured bacterium]|nr:MAG: hypothetical protein ACD_56C00113G0001 [uncultured bacterium]
MSVMDKLNVLYVITAGRYKGKDCNIHRDNFRSKRLALVAIDNPDSLVVVKKKNLAKLNKPGWFERFSDYTYGLEQWFKKEQGSGSNMLRTSSLAQPCALRKGDILASGEMVVAELRRGYNGSVLVRLHKTGWVELAPRLPIALQGNVNFKLAAELKQNDRLATGCLVVEGPVSDDANWANVYLDRVGCCIDTPSCIPLALA